MPENDCPIDGVNCVSIARVEALERALEAQKQHSSLAREKIYDRRSSRNCQTGYMRMTSMKHATMLKV